MDELLTWLKSRRNYAEGLQLLKDNGGSEFIVDLLSSGPDEYNTTKLHSEIERIAAAAPRPAPEPHPEPAGHLSDIQADYQDIEKCLKVKSQIKNLYKELLHLRSKLFTLPEGEDLHQCARAILFKNLQRQDLFDQLHYFEKNGHWFDDLPENQVKEFDPTDKKQLEQKIKNLMGNRSKAADNLRKPLPAAKKKFYQEKIEKLNQEIDKLKAKR